MVTFVGEGGADVGSVDGGGEDVSEDGCESGSVGGCKYGGYGCGQNGCDGEDGEDGCSKSDGDGCCEGGGKVE